MRPIRNRVNRRLEGQDGGDPAEEMAEEDALAGEEDWIEVQEF